MSEFEKMLSGKEYNSTDEELRKKAAKLKI